MHGIERSRRLKDGPPEQGAGVERIVIRYSDGREYVFLPEGGRQGFSGDDALQMAEILDMASGRSEWAEITEQSGF
jgi:hypothetical protein